MRKIVLLSFAVFFLYGCGHIFNPYSSKFQCPETYKGACVSTKAAYRRSIEDRDKPRQAKDQEASSKAPSPGEVYRENLYTKMARLIEAPRAPMVAPPDVARVLILSYTGDDNVLFSYRYVYFFLDKPRWILSPVEDVKK